MVQFFQNAKGYVKGERFTVGDKQLPLEHADRFTVFRSGTLRLRRGDLVRITQNGRTADGEAPAHQRRGFHGE